MAKAKDFIEKNKTEYSETVNCQYAGIQFKVKRIISFTDMITFVDNVSRGCFDYETGEYYPEARDYGFKVSVFEMYTDIELPEDSSERYAFIYGDDNLFYYIISRINKGQFDAIQDSIEERINNTLNLNTDNVNRQLNELHTQLTNIATGFSSVLGGVSGEDIKKILSSISKGRIDEEKLMKAWIDAKNDGKGEDGQ